MAWENVFFDGGDCATVQQKWDGYSGNITNVASVGTSTVIYARHGLLIRTVGVGWFYKNFNVKRKWVVGFAAAHYDSGSDKVHIDFMYDNSVQMRFTIGYYSCNLYRGVSTELLGTAADGFPANTEWNYFECEIYIDSTNGYGIVKKNGISLIDVSSKNTQELTENEVNRIRVYPDTLNKNIYLDDLYIRSGTESDTNGFLGDIRIDCIVPTADTLKEFTPSTGTVNAECLDEIPPSETDYVTSGSYGSKDIYRFTNTLDLPGQILAIQQSSLCKKSTTGISQGLKHIIRVNGTDHEKDAFIPDGTSKFYTNIWDTNPDNDNLWDIDDINSLDAGLLAES